MRNDLTAPVPIVTFTDDPLPALPIKHIRAILNAARRVDTPMAQRYARHAEQVLAALDPRPKRKARRTPEAKR